MYTFWLAALALAVKVTLPEAPFSISIGLPDVPMLPLVDVRLVAKELRAVEAACVMLELALAVIDPPEDVPAVILPNDRAPLELVRLTVLVLPVEVAVICVGLPVEYWLRLF